MTEYRLQKALLTKGNNFTTAATRKKVSSYVAMKQAYFTKALAPRTVQLDNLVALADKQRATLSLVNPNPYTVITLGAYNYKPVVHNWIFHMEKLNVTNYIVLCADKQIYQEIDPGHAVLMDPTFKLNLTYVRAKKKKPISSRTRTTTKKRNTAIHSKSLAEAAAGLAGIRSSGDILEISRPDRSKKARVYKDGKLIMVMTPEPGSGDRSAESGPSVTNTIMKYSKNMLDFRRAESGKLARDRIALRNGIPDELDPAATADQSQQRRRKLEKIDGRPPPANVNSKSSLSKSTAKMFEKRLKTIGLEKGFSILMIIKHAAIDALLTAGHSVVWSDVDCIWMKRCAVDRVESLAQPKQTTIKPVKSALLSMTPSAEPIVDIASQQGLFPPETSDLLGTAVCTGFFVVNPTTGSLILIRSVKNAIIKQLASSKSGKGDQKTLNTVLMQIGGMKLGRGNLPKFLYGPSKITKQPREAMLKLDLKLLSLEEEHEGLVPFTVGFLPYDLFPRGDANLPTTAAVNEGTTTVASVKLTEKPKKITEAERQKLTSEMVQKNADEWDELHRDACIWHMYSQKKGDVKVESMRRDGVFLEENGDVDDDAEEDAEGTDADADDELKKEMLEAESQETGAAQSAL
jgi:hypothetical protein